MRRTSPKHRRGTAAVDLEERRAFVDSGGWIALLSLRDAHHVAAEALFREVSSRRILLITTNLVIAEVHRQLLFRAGIRAALAALEGIKAGDRLQIEFVTRDHHGSAVEWLRRFGDQPFTYADATSFAVMKARRCTSFIGFDGHFAIAGFTPWQPPK